MKRYVMTRLIFHRALYSVCFVLFFLFLFLPSGWTQSGYLFIYHINVGQGDSTLIISPAQKTVLIDAGNNGKGVKSVIPLLKLLKIKAIDYVVATHYDADHIGGLDEVIKYLDNINVAVLDRGNPEKEKTTKTFDGYVLAAGDKRKQIKVGEKLDLGPDIDFTCVAVNGQVEPGNIGDPSSIEENAGSVAFLLQYGKFDYFIGGDLTGGGRSGMKWTPDIESKVALVVGDVDVLRVSHHGSQTSSNESFLTALSPEVALISVGNGGSNRSRYHHPTRDILDRILELQGLNAVFQTNRGETNGGLSDDYMKVIRVENRNIVVATDGEIYLINGELFQTDN